MLIDLEKYTLNPRTLAEFDLTLTQNHIEHTISFRNVCYDAGRKR